MSIKGKKCRHKRDFYSDEDWFEKIWKYHFSYNVQSRGKVQNHIFHELSYIQMVNYFTPAIRLSRAYISQKTDEVAAASQREA